MNTKEAPKEEYYEWMEAYCDNILNKLTNQFNDDFRDDEEYTGLSFCFRILDGQTEEYSLLKLKSFFSLFNKTKVLEVIIDDQWIDRKKNNYLYIQAMVSDANFACLFPSIKVDIDWNRDKREDVN